MLKAPRAAVRFRRKRVIVASAVTSLAALAVASGGVAHAGSITRPAIRRSSPPKPRTTACGSTSSPSAARAGAASRWRRPARPFSIRRSPIPGTPTVIAATNPNEGLDFYWQPIGGSGWNHQQVAASLTTGSPPSIAQVGNSTVITSLGPNNSVDFYVQPIGGSGWSHQQVAPPGPSFSISSIAQVGSSSVIVADGPNVASASTTSRVGYQVRHARVRFCVRQRVVGDHRRR